MIGQRFRFNAPKIGLVFQEGKKVAVQIPAGAEIFAIDSVPDPVVDPQQQVHVTWEGKTITMFAIDIREGAEPILKETALPHPLIREGDDELRCESKSGSTTDLLSARFLEGPNL
jgi:hypothetical protein